MADDPTQALRDALQRARAIGRYQVEVGVMKAEALLAHCDALAARADTLQTERDALAEAVNVGAEQERALAQALWDVYGILGFDQDGDAEPHCSDLIGTVTRAAQEFRSDYDEPCEDCEAAEARVAALTAALRDLLEAVSSDECDLDHDGYCQTHFLGGPCEVAAARAVLADATNPDTAT